MTYSAYPWTGRPVAGPPAASVHHDPSHPHGASSVQENLADLERDISDLGERVAALRSTHAMYQIGRAHV